MVLRKLSQTLMVSLAFMVATFSSGLLQPAVAYATHQNGNSGHSGGNNGTLKIHELTDPSGTESNNPKVCSFNVEGFGFDEDQTGYLVFEVQGGDGPTGTDAGPFEFGPADEDGFYATEYFSLDAGHYKATLYGKDSGGSIDYEDDKAKSKVFKVSCATGEITTPEVLSEVICGPDNDKYSVVDGENYSVFDNGDGSFTLTADTGFVFEANGLTTLTIRGDIDTNTVCPPDEITTPEVLSEVICGPDNDKYSVVDGENYSVFDNGDGSFTLTADTGFVFEANGLTTLTIRGDIDTNTVCPPAVTPCVNPTNGGVITQNTAGWELYGDAEFVNEGIALSSESWSGSYIENTNDYSISDALQLDWTYEGTILGAHGIAIIFETADGDYIHYEPEPYSDDFWTTTAGILPANGGGQGGPYSGSLQDILDTAGDLTVVNTYFYFTSAVENNIVLKNLSFNCMTYTFDKEGEEPNPTADINYALICVEDGVKVTLTNSGDASGTATVNGTVHTVEANSTKEVVLDYDLGTPFMTEVTVTIGQVTKVETVNCTPGGGGGIPIIPTTPGQTLGTSTAVTPTPIAAAVLPAILPATGGIDSPFMVIVASILAYGAAYFLQGRRLIARKEAIQA